MDPIDLTYEKTISELFSGVGDYFSLFRRRYTRFSVARREDEDVYHYFSRRRPIQIPPSLFDKEPDTKKSYRGLESAAGGHSQDADFAENVTIIEIALLKTSLPGLRRKWVQRWLLPRIFYDQFNEADPEQQESVNSDETELCFRHHCRLPPIRFEATFQEKTIFKESYITDRNINFLGLDWIDELNFIQLPDQNEASQTPTLEHTNVENLVRCCNHIAEIPLPSVPTQLPKPDSHRTQL
ncbi:hypothetical protein ACTXT7_010962 [Hymenolepis weldensis]